MIIKRYQLVLISFALGISFITFSLNWFIDLREETIPVPDIGVEDAIFNVFFSSTGQDPNTLYCDRTYPVVREISALTNNPESRLGELVYVVLKELIKGPTQPEIDQGFITSINIGTKVQEISIVDGVATVDFNDVFNENVSGSCRVQAIRSQIDETLKQFSEIEEVVISVDGDSQNVLQP